METTRFEIPTMVGRVITEVRRENVGEDFIQFHFDGGHLALYHDQCCCEWVDLEDVAGDLADLIGEPLTTAEEVSGGEFVGEKTPGADSETWTFYRFGTRKGMVVLRFYGTSNGFYSEDVYWEFRDHVGRPVEVTWAE